MKDIFRYDKMVETALRGVVREALERSAKTGLPGSHHFYVTFRTDADGVEIPDNLRAKYPVEMTIVLEHQFWDLEVTETEFSVTLSFSNRPERIRVPLAAITAFADPSVKFGLQFQETAPDAPADTAEKAKKPASEPAKLRLAPATPETPPAKTDDKPEEKAGKPGGEVVTLDAFRKK
jgi:hypothetical protein